MVVGDWLARTSEVADWLFGIVLVGIWLAVELPDDFLADAVLVGDWLGGVVLLGDWLVGTVVAADWLCSISVGDWLDGVELIGDLTGDGVLLCDWLVVTVGVGDWLGNAVADLLIGAELVWDWLYSDVLPGDWLEDPVLDELIGADDWSEPSVQEGVGVLSVLEDVWLDAAVRLTDARLEDEVLFSSAAALVWRFYKEKKSSTGISCWDHSTKYIKSDAAKQSPCRTI